MAAEAWEKESSPESQSETASTVVAEEDWSSAVTPTPSKKPPRLGSVCKTLPFSNIA